MRRLAVVLVLCLPMLAQTRNDELHQLFEDYYEDYLRENPEEATSVGRTEYNDRWRDWSRPARQRWTERVKLYRSRLDGFDPEALGLQDGISWRLLRRQLDLELAGLDYDAYLIRVNQLFGLHTSVLLTMREMPARTPADYESMIARLRAVPAYVAQNIAALREAVEKSGDILRNVGRNGAEYRRSSRGRREGHRAAPPGRRLGHRPIGCAGGPNARGIAPARSVSKFPCQRSRDQPGSLAY